MCSSQNEQKPPVPKKSLVESSNNYLTWCKDIWDILLHDIDIKKLPLDQRIRIINVRRLK